MLRKGLVYSMKMGDTLVINLSKTLPSFKSEYTDRLAFPTERIFDYEHWHNPCNYMHVVKEEENVDVHGNKKCYVMNPKF